MNQLRRLLFPSVSLVIFCAAIATTSADAQSSGRREPAHWIPVSIAITKTGELRRDMLSQLDLSVIDGNRARNSTGCTMFIAPSATEEFLDLRSLDGLVASSITIVRGRVTASETGFYNGHPGTLYTLQPGPPLKRYIPLGEQSSLFRNLPGSECDTIRRAAPSR